MRDPLFANHLRERPTGAAIDTAIARVLVGLVSIWKLLSYDMGVLYEWPAILFETDRHAHFFPGSAFLTFLPLEVGVTIVALTLFTLGFRLGLTSFASAILVAHLTALHYVVTNSGATFIPFVYAYLFFGINRDEDRLSLDALAARMREPLSTLRAELARASVRAGRATALAWILVATASMYFFTGLAKIHRTGFDWGTPENLGLLIHQEAIMHLDAIPPLAELLLDNRLLLALGSSSTLLLECGFLPAVLLGLPYFPFVLGLAGMHTMIWLAMGILFFDQYLLYLLFIPWHRLHGWLSRREPLQVTYDAECRFCAASLLLVREFDLAGTIEFRAGPAGLAAVAVRRGADEFTGHRAFREIARQLGLLRPLGAAMDIPGVDRVAAGIYRRIAARRACRALAAPATG